MSYTNSRNTLSSFLIGLGGSVFFAGVGAALAIGACYVLFSGHSSSSGGFEGFGLGVAILMFIGIGLVVGFVAGLAIMAWLQGKPKLLGLSILISFLGYSGGLYGLYWYLRVEQNARAATVETIARADAHKQELAKLDAENQRLAKANLPSLLQDLFYPGAEILDGGFPPGHERVILSVRAAFETVCDYYASKLPDAHVQDGVLRGKTRRPGDGRMVEVLVSHRGGRVTISIVIDVSDYQEQTNAASAAAQPKPANPNATESASTTAPASVFDSDPSWVLTASVEELNTAYGNLIYPGSHTNYPSTTHPRPDVPGSAAALATTDAFETVVNYYRPLLTIQSDLPDKFVGTAKRADGRMAFIDLSSKNGLTFIGLSAQ